MKTPKVGDQVYYVSRYGKIQGHDYVTVTKVGRKYAYLSNRKRYTIESGIVDAGQYTSNAKVYESREAYQAEMLKVALWRQIANKFRYAPSNLLTLDDLTKIAQMVGVDTRATASDLGIGDFNALTDSLADYDDGTTKPSA